MNYVPKDKFKFRCETCKHAGAETSDDVSCCNCCGEQFGDEMEVADFYDEDPELVRLAKPTLADLLNMVKSGEAIRATNITRLVGCDVDDNGKFDYTYAYKVNGVDNRKRIINIALVDNTNECSFVATIFDATLIELTEKLMRKGLDYWYEAASGSEIKEDDLFFTAEDKVSMYWQGYSEPADELLTRCGVEHMMLDYDENEEYDFVVIY